MENDTEKPTRFSRLREQLTPGRETFAGLYLALNGWILHTLSASLDEATLSGLGPLSDRLTAQFEEMQQGGTLQGVERMFYLLGAGVAVHGGTRMYQERTAYTAPVKAYFMTFHPRLYKLFFMEKSLTKDSDQLEKSNEDPND